mmetsp:Transcript_23645/g.50609  ORF Transcript_23645/g.50609 Transcript_23645/m.50609 type:complete len:413 (-) Transcript_23645:70-1308(-)|eukprot:CAMPEP_0172532112 /NCGR_PEP_ID=MMETSP1067-20121228/5280_1 /TAXON_ID=265564 ORGANISM="Thalassiosira punctigera, Strain Tpunct2005C2" /NCGR_SAMPLE_ID=MMETSP1067 /ASSEMBLY_ACC=CAM_ASM_000444 /LENGTH=412 /DNA_ID=CAMNT_0013316583 /DNA_START=40 /DNA_END=1281 /DNA_ORIENTATION=-
MIRHADSAMGSCYRRQISRTLHRSWFGQHGTTGRAMPASCIPLLARVAPEYRLNHSPALWMHSLRRIDGNGSMWRSNARDAATSRAPKPKSFSAAAAASNSTAGASESKQSKDGGTKKEEDNSNLFLDNLGKIFLSSIGLVLVMLLRSTRSNNSRKELVEEIESAALLDPLEIDDLRLSNSDFTIEIWEKIAREIQNDFHGRSKVTYPEFLTVVTRAMRDAKGEGFTVQLGHLVDRVVIAELERMGGEEDNDDAIHGEGGALLNKELPLTFLFASLSLALYSTVADRVRVLFEAMSNDADAAPALDATTVPGERVSEMVGHLQNTCQLIPGAQVVETNSKVPYQSYRVGTGDELTRRAREGYGGKKGNAGVTSDAEGPVSLEDFHAILKSRTVCAWGECYVKKEGRVSTSDR